MASRTADALACGQVRHLQTGGNVKCCRGIPRFLFLRRSRISEGSGPTSVGLIRAKNVCLSSEGHLEELKETLSDHISVEHPDTVID